MLSLNFKIYLTLFLGSLVWTLTMFKSGQIYPFGMGFWGAHGHDAVWHLSIISALAQGQTELPIFAGEKITGYHIGFDALVAALVVVTKVDASSWYFRILPIVLSLGSGILVWKLFKNVWSVLMFYFASSWGWAVSGLRYGQWLGGESMFWSQQAVTTLINPPFALSLFLLLLGFFYWQKQRNLISGVIWGLLAITKVYAAVLVFGALGVVILVKLIKKTQWFNEGKILAVMLAVTLFTFTPFVWGAKTTFIWSPGWFLEVMMAVSDRVNWPKFYQAMTTYRMGDIYFKGVLAYAVAFAIFVFGNLGLRFLGFSLVLKNLTYAKLFICVIGVLAFGLPMVFVQSGTPWNTIQFVYYALALTGLYAGLVISKFNTLVKVVFLLIFTLNVYGSLSHYLPTRPPAMISQEELQALSFLKSLAPGTVLTYPFEKKQLEPPVPLYHYESTAYVSAFSHHVVFMEDEVNLSILGLNWNQRKHQMQTFFTTYDRLVAKEILATNQIAYVYLYDVATTQPKFSASEVGMKVLYENSKSAIWGRIAI